MAKDNGVGVKVAEGLNGAKSGGKEQSRASGVEWSGVEWSGVSWTGLGRLSWTGLGWLSWTGLGWLF